MDKKKILILICVFVIIIVTLLILINSLNKKQNSEINIINNENSNIVINEASNYETNNIDTGNNISESENDSIEYVESVYTRKLKYETDKAYYQTINALFENYINLVGFKNTENLKLILSPQYIKTYNITDNNILNKVNVPKLNSAKQYYRVTITSVLTTDIDDSTKVYIVKGKCRVEGNTKENVDIQAMIEIDCGKQLYNLYMEDYLKNNNFDNLKYGDVLNYKAEEISDRNKNKFEYINAKNDYEMAKEYFKDLKEIILHYPDEAYRKLDREYADKKFNNKEEFKAYINDNYNLFNTMVLEQYKVVPTEEAAYFICADQYGGIYTFKLSEGVMNYTVFLDNYTSVLSSKITGYSSLSKEKKAEDCLNKFMRMINTKDYDSIYNCLDVTFKTNNFNSKETLKNIFTEKLYEINTYTINELKKEDDECIIFKCKITNKINIAEETNMNVVIKLGEGTNFTMSFSFE